MPIICRTSPELGFDSVATRHSARSVWVLDVETQRHELRIDGNVVGAYGIKANGKPFAECGEDNVVASERLSIHTRTPSPSVEETRRAITAIALSMWQVAY